MMIMSITCNVPKNHLRSKKQATSCDKMFVELKKHFETNVNFLKSK